MTIRSSDNWKHGADFTSAPSDFSQMCCATCVYYNGKYCRKRVKGWLAKDALTYFCKSWESKLKL